MEFGLKEEVIELLREKERIEKKLRKIAFDIEEKDGNIALGIKPKDIAYKQILRTKFGIII